MNGRRGTTTQMQIAKNVALALTILLLAGCATTPLSVVELPRPNSGEFTTAQAAARRAEIYSLARSGMKADWRGPSSGFNVHITRDDDVIVYAGSWQKIVDGKWQTDSPRKIGVAELKAVLVDYENRIISAPLSILITTEREPRTSLALKRMIEMFFEPWVQIYYLKR